MQPRPPVAALTILVLTVAFATAGGEPSPRPVRVGAQAMLELRLPFGAVDYPRGTPGWLARDAADDLQAAYTAAGKAPALPLRIVLFGRGMPGSLSLAPRDAEDLARAISIYVTGRVLAWAAPPAAPAGPRAVLEGWTWWTVGAQVREGGRLYASGLPPGSVPRVVVDGVPLRGPVPVVAPDGTVTVNVPGLAQFATIDGMLAEPAQGWPPAPPPGQ